VVPKEKGNRKSATRSDTCERSGLIWRSLGFETNDRAQGETYLARKLENEWCAIGERMLQRQNFGIECRAT